MRLRKLHIKREMVDIRNSKLEFWFGGSDFRFSVPSENQNFGIEKNLNKRMKWGQDTSNSTRCPKWRDSFKLQKWKNISIFGNLWMGETLPLTPGKGLPTFETQISNFPLIRTISGLFPKICTTWKKKLCWSFIWLSDKCRKLSYCNTTRSCTTVVW